MRSLLKYLKKYRVESVLAPLFKMLEAVFELIVPLIVADMIDTGVKQADTAYIWRSGGILLAFGVVGLVISMTSQYFSARAGMGFGAELRNALFSHINKFSYRELDALGTPTLITRMTADSVQAQNSVNLFLRLFMRAPFIVLGALVMSFTIDWAMGLLFLAATPLVGGTIYFIIKKSLPYYAKIQRTVDEVSTVTRENLEGARVIRAFSNQAEEVERFDKATEKLKSLQLRVGKLSALHNPMTYAVVNLAIILILYIGGGFADVGRLTQGEVTALVNYMMQILLALVALSVLITTMTKGFASAKRIQEVFETKPSVIEDGTVTEGREDAPVCEWKGVGFRYNDTGDYALENIDFCLKKGETLGIIGGTGSGKTTLVNLLPRFYDVTEGEVLLHGVNVKEYTLSALRDKIGVVPQRAVLFKGTVRENMQWGKANAADEEIWQALRMAEGEEVVNGKAEKLDYQINQGGKNLSGGQRQRLTIARALVKQPDVLILDDSASALDYATDAKLRKNLKEVGCAVLMISQRAAGIRHADRILVLDNGRMVGFGTHAELAENCRVYREICLSQLSQEELEA